MAVRVLPTDSVRAANEELRIVFLRRRQREVLMADCTSLIHGEVAVGETAYVAQILLIVRNEEDKPVDIVLAKEQLHALEFIPIVVDPVRCPL